METTLIGIKELHRTLPHVTREVGRGKSFLVIRHAKPVFRIDPVLPRRANGVLSALKDLQTITFSHRDKNLSKHIDGILYAA